MSDTDWLEPLDRRIEQVRQETEAIRKGQCCVETPLRQQRRGHEDSC
jgi:hypothetical protein